MADTTTRLGLTQPEMTDNIIDSIPALYSNMAKIDLAAAKGKWDAAVDPTATDDELDGYVVGSAWWNILDHKLFICEDPTAGAAVWRQIWPVLPAGVAFAATSKILARKTAGAGAGEEISLSDLLDFIGSAERGDILYRDASEWARLAAATRGQAFITGGASANPLYIDYHSDIYRQLLINGGFQINQQAVSPYTSATTPANNDDTYAAPDQWILLSDGNDVVDVYQKTTLLPPGAAAALLLEVETAGKKFGILQIVESKDAIKYAGQVASLQFKARTTAGKIIRNIRAAILSWTGTADAVTSDVVSAWNAEGENPTWAANWTAENTPGDLALVGGYWTTYRIENISIDTAGLTNLAVFIWCDDGDAAVDDLMHLADVQLNVGPVCLPYMPRSFADELHRCMRYYQKSYAYATAPGTITQTGNRYSIAASSYTFYDAMIAFLVPMAKTPSVTAYSTATGAANNVYREGIGDVAATTSDKSEVSFLVNLGGGGVVNDPYRVQWVAAARL